MEPKLAVPESVGLEITLGGCLVTEALADQRFTVPALLLFVVRAVMNLPASAET